MRKLLTLSLSLFSFLSHSQSQLFITSKNGLQNDTVNHIVSDQNESLWIATINGLSEFELDGTLNVISQTNGMNISDVDVHPSSGVWMVEDSLVAQYFNNQLTVYPMTSTVNSWMPNEIEVLRNGDVYCLFGGVLYQFANGTFQKLNFSNSSYANHHLYHLNKANNSVFVSSASGPNSIHISGSQDVIIQNWNLYRPVRVFEWNGGDYGVNGKYIFKRVQTNWTLHDSLVGDYTTSGTAIDKSDGKVLINTNFGNQVYDMQTGMFVRYPVRPNCSWNSGIGEFSYARKRLAFSNYFGGVGLFYYPKYNFKEELALGPLRYSFEYEHYFKSYAYMDTIGRTIPMSFFDGFNVTAKMQGQRKAAALVQHGGRESDWVFGPISNVSYRPSCHDKYGYVMKVLKSEVDYHKLNYNQTGYVTPMSIANWPGNGRVWEGESLTLAPFYDANNNGSFEPNFGDYPLIPGDECIYAMYNEPIKNSQYGLGLEVHRFAYIFKNGATVNQKTVYHHFAVVNRSGQTLDSLQFSLLSDMDLGNQSDDIGLMDTTTNAFYTMNSQIDKGVFNHGTYPYQIAEGFTSLDHRIVSHNIQWPFSFNELMNQVNGKYADGTPIYDSTLYTTGKFEYLWDGDTSLTFVRKGYWQGQDTRQVSYLEPITLLPNEKACFNFAFTYDVLNDSLDHWGALKLTQSRMQNIRSHWQNQGSVMCLMPTLAEEEFSQIDFKIYPNPSSGKFKIQSLEPIEQIELVDVQGRTILLRKANAKIIEIDEKLNSGLYVVKIMVNRSWISQRLMVLD